MLYFLSVIRVLTTRSSRCSGSIVVVTAVVIFTGTVVVMAVMVNVVAL